MDVTPPRPARRARDRVIGSLLVAAFATAAAIATAAPGEGATVTAGPAVVTVTPTAGLADGQVVAIHAEVPEGSRIYAIRARQCRPDARIDNTSKFGFQGRMCPVAGIGAGQFDEGFEPEGETRAVDLSFAVGLGAITWVNELGYANELECGPGHPCDLVVQLQVPGDTLYATFPLLIGEGAEPGAAALPEPPPAAPDVPAAEEAPLPEDLPALVEDSTQSGTATAAKSAKTDAGSATEGGTADGQAASARNAGDGTSTELASSTRSAISSSDASRALRVYSGGIAGLVGGALIAWIVVRARRRMDLMGAA